MSYIWRKTETLQKLMEICRNKERFSIFNLLKLYRNLLHVHQVSAYWNFEANFHFVSALLKLDWNLHIRIPLTEKLDGIQLKLCNSFGIAETIQETSTQSFYIVSAESVLLKRYFSSGDIFDDMHLTCILPFHL